MSDQSQPRNWLELPRDLTTVIFSILGPVEILQNLQCVCTQWRNISKDPSLWRSINFRDWDWGDFDIYEIDEACIGAVDRSNGGLVEITIKDFGSDVLLARLADRARHLKRLRLVYCPDVTDKGLWKAVPKLTELEELEFSYCYISPGSLVDVGCRCPQLKSFKLNNNHDYDDDDSDDDEDEMDKAALAIAKHMNQLNHLQLFGNNLTNRGLQAILDGCPHLESLDLRHCFNVKLEGDLEKRCTEKIKHLQRPYDSTQDYEYKFYHKSRSSYEDDLFGFPDEDSDYDYGLECSNGSFPPNLYGYFFDGY